MGQGRRAIIWTFSGLCLLGAGCAGARTAAGSPAATQPVPAFAHTVVLAPLSGKVLIDLAGSPGAFVRLTSRRVVPVGTVVDATAGRVGLTSANPAPYSTQTGQFFGGIFRIEQRRADYGLVNLVIRDNLSRAVCGPAQAHTAALSHRILGLLRGTARGHFRTTGRFAAATVRGTNWGVRDRCDGTLTVVREGAVIVRDFRLNTNVVVRAGHTYLAMAG